MIAQINLINTDARRAGALSSINMIIPKLQGYKAFSANNSPARRLQNSVLQQNTKSILPTRLNRKLQSTHSLEINRNQNIYQIIKSNIHPFAPSSRKKRDSKSAKVSDHLTSPLPPSNSLPKTLGDYPSRFGNDGSPLRSTKNNNGPKVPPCHQTRGRNNDH